MIKRNAVDFSVIDEILEEHDKSFLVEICKNYHKEAWVYK